jgi:hypothetical protein
VQLEKLGETKSLDQLLMLTVMMHVSKLCADVLSFKILIFPYAGSKILKSDY